MTPETLQTIQQVLMYAGIALLALGVILLGVAAYLYRAYNIPDIRNDLSGKKRAEAIANMAAPGTGMLKNRAAQQAKSIRAQERLAAEPVVAHEEVRGGRTSAAEQEANESVVPSCQSRAVEPLVDDEAPTSVMDEDGASTTMLADDAGEEPTRLRGAAASDDEREESLEASVVTIGEEEQETVRRPLPEGFKVVQKAVLMGSNGFVRMDRGEGHA